MTELQAVRSQATDAKFGQTRVDGAWLGRIDADMPIAEEDCGRAGVTEVDGRLVGIDVIELLEHRLVGGGGRLEGVDLAGIGEQCGAGR